MYITKALQFYLKIVIGYELKPPNHRRETKQPSLLPWAPFHVKGIAFTFYSSYSESLIFIALSLVVLRIF